MRYLNIIYFILSYIIKYILKFWLSYNVTLGFSFCYVQWEKKVLFLLGGERIFQQVDAICYMARNVKHWLKEHDEEFQVFIRSFNSPDLNLTERLSDRLVCHVSLFVLCYVWSTALSLAPDTCDNLPGPYWVTPNPFS